MLVQRRDVGTLQVLEKGDGFLRARVRFARAGVFPYYVDGKILHEAKLPEELFSTKTIHSAKRVPITDGHPAELLSPSNYAQHIRGTVGDSIVVADGFLEAEETIFDASLIEKIKKGEAAEVSIGFTCRQDFSAGTYEGARYDSVQRDIVINHIAHVPEGRAGKDVRVYLDSANIPTTRLDHLDHKERNDMAEQTAPSAQPQEDEKIFEAIKKFFSGLFSNSQAATQPTQADTKLQEENVTLKQKLAEQEAELKKLKEATKSEGYAKQKADALDKEISERMSIVETAKSAIEKYDHAGKTNRQIKMDVLVKVLPAQGLETWSDEAVSNRFDAAKELLKKKAELEKSGVKTDAVDEITKLKDARLNIWQGDK